HGRAGDAQRSPDLTRAHPVVGEPQHLFDLSHGQLSPGRHPILLVVEDWDAAVADPRGCAIADAGYRVADIKSERWPASRRNGWPASVGIRKQGALFYEFSLDTHVPADHLLRSIDRFVDLSDLRRALAPFYASTGRPSVDPELMIRMLLI